MVIISDGESAAATEAVIRTLHQTLRHSPEFRFSKCSSKVKDGFFDGVSGCQFTVRALIVKKEEIYSKHLRESDDKFYNYFVKQLMVFDGGRLANAKIRIDGSGDREFRRALAAYLRRELGQKVKDVRMSDSQRDQLMQLADMCIGAIARAQRTRKDADRWLKQLRPHIEDIWHYR